MKKSAKKGTDAVKPSYKTVNGMAIEPCVYKGKWAGCGTFVAAKFENGDLVLDKSGKPVPYKMLVSS